MSLTNFLNSAPQPNLSDPYDLSWLDDSLIAKLQAQLNKGVSRIHLAYSEARKQENLGRRVGLSVFPQGKEQFKMKCFLPETQMHKNWSAIESWANAQLQLMEAQLKRKTSMIEGGYCGLNEPRVCRSVVLHGIEVEFDGWVTKVSHLEKIRDTWTASAIAEHLPGFGVAAKAVNKLKDGEVIEFPFDSIREANLPDFCHRLRTEALAKWPSLQRSILDDDDDDGLGRELLIEEGSTGVFEQANGVVKVRVKVA